MNTRTLPYLLASAIAIAVSAPVAADVVNAGSLADDARASYSGVFNFADASPVPRASSTLVRNANGISMTLSSSGLGPRNAYTIWWVIINNPEECAAVPCALTDLGNPAANASVVWATGAVSDAFGDADFAAHLVVGEDPKGQVLFGPGLAGTDAEIHVIVRSHGLALSLSKPGRLEEALTTLDGGCDINECSDLQFAIHLP